VCQGRATVVGKRSEVQVFFGDADLVARLIEAAGVAGRFDVEVYKHGDRTTPKGKEHLLQMLTDPTPF
jgi:hypothetical protein